MYSYSQWRLSSCWSIEADVISWRYVNVNHESGVTWASWRLISHLRVDCSFNSDFWLTTKKLSKLRVVGPLQENLSSVDAPENTCEVRECFRTMTSSWHKNEAHCRKNIRMVHVLESRWPVWTIQMFDHPYLLYYIPSLLTMGQFLTSKCCHIRLKLSILKENHFWSNEILAMMK